MPFFQYKAVTSDGKLVEGILEAVDQQVVLTRLEELGRLPIKVSSEQERGIFGRELSLPWKRKRVSGNDLLVFNQELSTLIHAGLPLDRSLGILSDLTENEYLREIVRELLKEIKGGKSLSEAMAMHPQVFSKLYVSMTRAGEAGSALDQILDRISEYLENLEELKSYLVSALIYPTILGLVGAGSIIVMVTFVIPRFSAIFENAGAPIPIPMRILLAISTVLTGYWWLLLGVAAITWYSARRRLASETGRLDWDQRLLKLPLIGKVIQKLEVSRFSRTLGTLLKSAVPLIQSINIVRDVISNQAIASAMEPIKAGVKKGEGLARPIREAEIFPPFAVHLLEVGEETGRLDDMLLQIADTYDRELRTGIKQLIALFEPAIILFMGLVIGTMVVSMLYSIFSINDVPL